MNQDESVALWRRGKDAWNAWAEDMLRQKAELQKAGAWNGDKPHAQWSDETRKWNEAAQTDLSGLRFMTRALADAAKKQAGQEGDSSQRPDANIKTLAVEGRKMVLLIMHSVCRVSGVPTICILIALLFGGIGSSNSGFAQGAAEPAHVEGLQPSITLALAIFVATVLVLLRRQVFIALTRTFRLAFKPLARFARSLSKIFFRLLRFFRLVSRTRGRHIESFVGLSVDAVARTLTETDEEIAKDFDVKLANMKRRKRFLCSWIEIDAYQEQSHNKELAIKDSEKAERFFKTEVRSDSNPLNLYDDIIGADVVRMFKDSDKVCFYILSEFRKAITINVISLTLIFSIIASGVAIINLSLSESVNFYDWLNLHKYVPEIIEFRGRNYHSSDLLNKGILVVASSLFGILAMALFYYISYEQAQRNNSQQVKLFLSQYLNAIRVGYVDVVANASRAVVAEKSSEEIKNDIVLWNTNLFWLAFSMFFIELFIRNILFQMRRNSIYAIVLIPIFFVILLLLATLVGFHEMNIFDISSEFYQQNSFYFFSTVTEAMRGGWPKFSGLDVLHSMNDVMESYAKLLDSFRHRFTPGPGY